MAKAETKIAWLPMRVIVSRVARHLSCAPEDVWLRIVEEGEADRIKACGLTVEGWPMSLLPAAWRGIDRDADVDLRLDDLVATGLLPAPAERARWSAEETVAYLVKGVPLPWKEWQGAGATASEIERAEIALGEAIGADQVPAWGRRSLYGPIERIPAGDFRPEMVAMKSLPVNPLRLPKVVVGVDGKVGVSPRHRLPDYMGSPWCSIECDPAGLRQAFPKPLRAERRILDEAEQLYAEGGSEPAARAEESMPEPAPAVRPTPPAEPKQPAPKKAVKRRRRHGPRPGKIDRFAEADRALFPEVTTLIKQKHITPGEAARILSDKIEGRGNDDSKARRLATRYRKEVKKTRRKKSKATRRNS